MFAAIPWDDDWCTHYAVAPHEHRLCYTRRQLSRSLAVRSAATIEQQLIDRLAKTIQAKELMIGEGSAVIPKQRIEEPAVVPIQLAPARRQARWRLALGVLIWRWHSSTARGSSKRSGSPVQRSRPGCCWGCSRSQAAF